MEVGQKAFFGEGTAKILFKSDFIRGELNSPPVSVVHTIPNKSQTYNNGRVSDTSSTRPILILRGVLRSVVGQFL